FSDGWKIALGFFVGALGSAVAGLIGMNISVRANVRAAVRAKNGLNAALGVAIRGGSVTGLTVISLALLGLVSFQILYDNPRLMIGFIFGASIVSLFARVGGGIFTKGADVGADLVGKIEQGLPEDDERNPAVIADNVGDNVGDCAGMGADLYETFVVTALAAVLLATLLDLGTNFLIFPLVLGAVALLSTIAGIFFVRKGPKQRIMGALYKGLIATVILSIIGFYIVIDLLMNDVVVLFADAVIGIIIMLIFV
ncbi:membrane-bound proton-translocating pyrophosphatase, partial [mine drainage metagenome]